MYEAVGEFDATLWSTGLTAKPATSRPPLWPLLLIVNGGWIAFVIAARTVLPESIADPDGWPRAVVRVGIVLIPVVVYLAKDEQIPWPDRLGLVTNARRGLIVGVAVSLLWLIPQFVTRWKSGHSAWEFNLPAGVWLNAIVGSPFAEELLYRQIVFRALSERLALWKAFGASAFWFTLLHLPAAITSTTTTELVQYLSVIFVYGVVFAFAYSLARSLWASLIPHVANNVFFAVVVGE